MDMHWLEIMAYAVLDACATASIVAAILMIRWPHH
jgi:hypothetical protein